MDLHWYFGEIYIVYTVLEKEMQKKWLVNFIVKNKVWFETLDRDMTEWCTDVLFSIIMYTVDFASKGR